MDKNQKHSDDITITIGSDPVQIVDRFCKIYEIKDCRLITGTKTLLKAAENMKSGDVVLYECETRKIMDLFNAEANAIFDIALQNGLVPVELAGCSFETNVFQYTQIWVLRKR